MNIRFAHLATLLCSTFSTFALACVQPEPLPCEDESSCDEERGDPAAGEDVDEAQAAIISCPAGWHYHYTTWPATGLYMSPGGSPCSVKLGSVPAGTPMCMKDGPATPCSGQGYSRVRNAFGQEYWARTEAFNGH